MRVDSAERLPQRSHARSHRPPVNNRRWPDSSFLSQSPASFPYEERIMRAGLWLVFGVLQAAAWGAPCDSQAQLVINEILAAPGRDWNGDGVISSRDDEWVEIYNAGDAPVTLDGYRIADADTSWRRELSGTLAPHARRLVYGLESYNWEKAT